MGTLTSATNWTGKDINGCTLGSPTFDGTVYAWNDGALPDGVIDAEGVITVTVVNL